MIEQFGVAPPPPILLEGLYLAIKTLYESRYLAPRYRLPVSSDLRDRVLDAYSSTRFKDIIRLTREQFDQLITLVSPSQHFGGMGQDEPEDVQSASIILQMKVALFCLGTKGVSVKKVAFIFGVSAGSVLAYTWRCIFASEELVPQFVVWPDMKKKRTIKAFYLKRYGFPHVVGAVDGVPFPFDRAPAYQSQAWITRKCYYAMGATAVCDHVGRFTAPTLFKSEANYFQGHEYLLADAPYALSQSVLSRYRSGEGDQVLFYSLHGSARATIENSFGMLKLKFQSLQNLPIQINTRVDMDKVAS
ncbi:hypothetical protein BGZ89_006077 [Linnemannia elongata]|nr:hypothetical protein BGZ89_006077 [Linnemannia elongata]